MPFVKTQAFLYLRLSVDEEEGRAQSIEAQRYEAHRYAKAHSINIIEEFVDAGVSGQRTSRPAFDRMLARACAVPSPVGTVLVYKLDRFARNQRTFHNAFHQLGLANVALVSVSEQFGHGRNARLGMSVSAIMAEQQAIAASIHTGKSRRENARQGYWNGGPVPFGYRSYVAVTAGKKSRMRLEVVEEEAAVVRQIYAWASESHGSRWIVQALNERGITLRGAKFTNGNVAGILAREHYVGRYFDRTCDDEGKKPERED